MRQNPFPSKLHEEKLNLKLPYIIVLFLSQALISDFIYVDMAATAAAGASPAHAAEEQGQQRQELRQQQDLEVHVMAIEERWFVLCGWLEERRRTLAEALRLWEAIREDSER